MPKSQRDAVFSLDELHDLDGRRYGRGVVFPAQGAAQFDAEIGGLLGFDDGIDAGHASVDGQQLRGRVFEPEPRAVMRQFVQLKFARHAQRSLVQQVSTVGDVEPGDELSQFDEFGLQAYDLFGGCIIAGLQPSSRQSAAAMPIACPPSAAVHMTRVEPLATWLDDMMRPPTKRLSRSGVT